ncbi:MAG: HPr family phosphocarrier protein [Lachnospiraceae bacterium]|nr:HPr family phosphocarrier protein [Lachnospiraceae bacterium]
MSEYKIRLQSSEVKDFVTRASACDFDIDVSYNHLTVDAKSILGVLAMDLRQILTVSCNGYSAEFENYLAGKYAVA